MAPIWHPRPLVPGTVVHVMGWVSQQHGSFERFLERLAARCASAGLKTHLVFPAHPRSEEFIRTVNARIHIVPLAKHLLDYRAWAGLRSVFKKTRATHIHAHSGLDAMLAMRIARTLKTRRFLSQHTVPGTSWSSKMRHRWLAQQAETLFAVSEPVVAALLSLGVPPEKIVQAPLGVDVMAYRPDSALRSATREALGIRDDEKVVLCTSHLREGKGVELLPPLAAALAQSPGNVRLLSAGAGPLRESLQAQSVNIPLQFLGLRHDIPELLAAADLFVLPRTRDDGRGLGPVEAMAAGLPIVASALSGQSAVIGEPMQLVPPGDLNALVAACRTLLADPDAAHTLGSRAREAAVTRFSVDAAVEAHVARYLA